MPSGVMVVEKIVKYDIAYYAGGKFANGYPYRAIIGLRRDDGSLIGGAYFHREHGTMPDTDEQKSTGYVWCHYRWEDFPNIVDILRNESPVYVRYVAGSWNTGSITTMSEPVGEGEPKDSE